MLNVALTGNAASGKSTVARWFEEWGATVIDADVLVRDLQARGTPVFAAIVRRFGPGVLAPDGSLDRSALRATVLADPRSLADLNALVHPAVRARREALVSAAAARDTQIVINVIPLLFEALDPREFDLVILVHAPVPVRRARLLERGLTAAEVERLMAAQQPSESKRSRSDIVIDNAGTLEQLAAAARAAWQTMKQRTPAVD